ncbi:hypothetical protein SLE2022_405670 [Rubroshorea leprosula]
MLHLTKVAVGCGDVDQLRARLDGRVAEDESWVGTRFRPTRHAEVVGGSLYWIIKHRLVARSAILGFVEDPEDARRIRIRVAPDLVPVRAHPKRAHQGWRYLAADAAPADLGGGEALGIAALPSFMAAELAALALI